jgi:Ca-activated chloride channel homolog
MIAFSRPLVLLALALIPALLLVSRNRRGLAWRLAVIALLVLALAGPQIGQRRTTQSVVFLIDRSPSVTATTSPQEIEDQIDAVASANPKRQFGAIAFADRAQVIASPNGSVPSLPETEAPLGEATHLARAVDLALATREPGTSLQLVLVSDGRITDGLPGAMAAAQRSGVPISTLAAGRSADEDVALAALEPPSQVEINRPFTIHVTVRAQKPGEATLAIYRDGELIVADTVPVAPGLSTVSFSDTLDTAGRHVYRARIRGTGDPITENDVLEAIVNTVAQPQLLVVAPQGAEAVAALLDASGRPFVETDTLPPLAELAGFREILLADTPLLSLSPDDVGVLETFVGNLGGGLVVAEGEAALSGFAGGGVERLLPVSYTVPQQGREASQAIVYLLDRSASMRGYAEGATKIDILKESVAASVELLDADALVGVIVFDREFAWLRPLEPLGDGTTLYEGLRSLTATGGTDLYYPIVGALDALETVDARLKSILLFSDGKTVDEYRDFDGLTERLSADGTVSLSAIAIGVDPNLSLLRSLVSASSGTLYTASNFASLPEISVKATQRLSRRRFITGETAVSGPLATGALEEIPSLNGYALTFAKPTAEVLLSAGQDPVLARWRFGLGWVAALNTDLAGRWTAPWLAWNKAPLLLDAVLTTAEPPGAVSVGLYPRAVATGRTIDLLVDARTPQGGFADFLDLSATLLPSEETRSLEQVNTGLYQARFPVGVPGGYAVRIDDLTRGSTTTLSVTVPYPEEYAATGPDTDTLRTIAEATGGKVLADEILPDDPAPPTLVRVDLHLPFLLGGLFLFLGELAWRKLAGRRSRGP